MSTINTSVPTYPLNNRVTTGYYLPNADQNSFQNEIIPQALFVPASQGPNQVLSGNRITSIEKSAQFHNMEISEGQEKVEDVCQRSEFYTDLEEMTFNADYVVYHFPKIKL